MAGPINQLHGFPRLANGPAPASFIRRGSILDGSVKVFPGPGQLPSAADGGDTYTPPTDWIPENYFGHRPQIIWCSLSTASDFPFIPEDSLYTGVFTDLQAMMAENRSGLTWVYIPVWVSSAFESYTRDYWGVDAPPGEDAAVVTKLYSQHAGPTMPDPFFGTNFLHLSFSVPYEPYSGNLLELFFSGTPLADDTIFHLGLEWIAQWPDLMCGWMVWAWMFNNTYADLRLAAMTAFIDASVAANPNIVYQGDAGGANFATPVTLTADQVYLQVAEYFGFN